MKKSQVWAVAMDFTKMDSSVFEYTRFLSSLLHPKKIYFMHVIKEMDSFPHLSDEFLAGFEHQQIVEKKLEQEYKIDQYFKDSGISYECHIMTGLPMDEVINLVVRKSVDLVIVGRKKVSGGAGIVSDRLSRNLSCNFLMVPEGYKPKLNNILVTTDFSEHSRIALGKAIEIKGRNEEIRLMTHHSYGVPVGYSKSGKSYEEFVAIMKLNAEKEMDQLLETFDSEIKPIITHRTEVSLDDQILEVAKSNDVDMIVIGSRGQSRASFDLLGSNTMKLLKSNEGIPLLIVKKEGENQNIVDAIKGTH
ncbi:MAG: universal stress protein [Bacteroidetes bacterium]|nr:universal stress protein [Bacteroidota bacterium]MDA1120193.1 universal stress protein [Bacteroidota bacterium]